MEDKLINRYPVIFYGIPDDNGRIYVKSNVEQMLPDLQEKTSKGMLCGELGHPGTPKINLADVSHIITDVESTEDALFVVIRLVETPKGKLLASILDSVVFRPRAFGRINEDGTVTVNEILSFDAIPVGEDTFATAQKVYDTTLF